MSVLTTRIATDLMTREEGPEFADAVRSRAHFTLDGFLELPKKYASGISCRLGEVIKESLGVLTAPEIALLLSFSHEGGFDLRHGDRQCVVFLREWKSRRWELAGWAFGEGSAMRPEDFLALLKLDDRNLPGVVDLFTTHREIGEALGYRPGDFFDWCCALVSVIGYEPSRTKDGVGPLLDLLDAIRLLAGARMVHRAHVAALARNVAEIHSLRGIRTLHVELLRALRTRDDALVKEISRERWVGGRYRAAGPPVRRGRKTPLPEQEEQ